MKNEERLQKRIKSWENRLGFEKFPEATHKILKEEEKPSFYCREVEELCQRCKGFQEMFGNRGCNYPESCSKPCEAILKIDALASDLMEQYEPFMERGFCDFNTQCGDNPHYTGYSFQGWDFGTEKNVVDMSTEELQECGILPKPRTRKTKKS